MEKKKPTYQTALKVNEGIAQPPQVSDDSVSAFKRKKKQLPTIAEFVQGIKKGNRILLSQAITLVESLLPAHQDMASEIIQQLLPYSGKSIRVGITGVPGVGKSSFIESFGLHVVYQKHTLAVLAIDPSSERSKGSILGDKTRMEQLSIHPDAFIRPSPAAGSLGGVARKTRETIILCEAAGFDVIFIETVGVGQSETAVHSMVDFFLLLMLAGAGDELQGIKRGIMEMADALVITKTDGSNVDKANRARAQYQNALHLFPLGESGWQPKVHTCSAHTNNGIAETWEIIQEYCRFTNKNGFFQSKRNNQAVYWIHETIRDALLTGFYGNPAIELKIKQMESDVRKGKISSFAAARELLENR